MGPEPPNLLQRVRWGNVAWALAAVAVLALVIAWPHLEHRAPTLPDGRASTAPARAPGAGEAHTLTVPPTALSRGPRPRERPPAVAGRAPTHRPARRRVVAHHRSRPSRAAPVPAPHPAAPPPPAAPNVAGPPSDPGPGGPSGDQEFLPG